MKQTIETIRGFEKYGVTPDGKVFNVKSGRQIKPHVNNAGYLRVPLRHPQDHKLVWKCVHRLVAETYIVNSNPIENDSVDHIDHNKLNNDVSNLRWIPITKNKRNQGYDIRCIELDKIFKTQKDAAEYVNGKQGAISRCCNQVKGNLTHRGYHWEFVQPNFE